MCTIIWDYKGFKDNKISFEDRNDANEIWKQLKEAGATNLRAEKPEIAKKFVVQVVFARSGKKYTYLAKEKVEVGSLVVVWTTDGRQVVQVVDSGMMSDAELAMICPLEKFRYIEGKVVAA